MFRIRPKLAVKSVHGSTLLTVRRRRCPHIFKREWEYDEEAEHDEPTGRPRQRLPERRLIHVGNRYYRYAANGNIMAEKDGATGYLRSDGTLIIHNPSAEDKGTVFYDENGKTFERDFQ